MTFSAAHNVKTDSKVDHPDVMHMINITNLFHSSAQKNLEYTLKNDTSCEGKLTKGERILNWLANPAI